jgi:hypothetical protein
MHSTFHLLRNQAQNNRDLKLLHNACKTKGNKRGLEIITNYYTKEKTPWAELARITRMQQSKVTNARLRMEMKTQEKYDWPKCTSCTGHWCRGSLLRLRKLRSLRLCPRGTAGGEAAAADGVDGEGEEGGYLKSSQVKKKVEKPCSRCMCTARRLWRSWCLISNKKAPYYL